MKQNLEKLKHLNDQPKSPRKPLAYQKRSRSRSRSRSKSYRKNYRDNRSSRHSTSRYRRHSSRSRSRSSRSSSRRFVIILIVLLKVLFVCTYERMKSLIFFYVDGEHLVEVDLGTIADVILHLHHHRLRLLGQEGMTKLNILSTILYLIWHKQNG